jgi:hypothetical protein
MNVREMGQVDIRVDWIHLAQVREHGIETPGSMSLELGIYLVSCSFH